MMTDKKQIVPFSLRDAPALIETIFPSQKVSVEAYKEQMAGSGKTLTPLGSFWKGRKPLILNKACILGCLLPTTSNLKRDLEIYEKLMGMDDESFVVRFSKRPRIQEILSKVKIDNIYDYFKIPPGFALPISSPFNISDYENMDISWREDITELERRKIEAKALPSLSYKEKVSNSKRPEEVISIIHNHIWQDVNQHLGTNAYSFPELVEQLGVMRFGHRPRVGDTFAGSGQIPFEAARLGCDVYASDLNPIACMLNWGSFNIIGCSNEKRVLLENKQKILIHKIQSEIENLGVEVNNEGLVAKVFLYCFEATCPQTGWKVPLLPSLVISKPRTGKLINVIAKLVPDNINKRYDIVIVNGVSNDELMSAEKNGTIRSETRGQDTYMVHSVNGVEYRTKISTLRGDYRNTNGSTENKLRLWGKSDFIPKQDDIFQERLYCIQWNRPKKSGKGDDFEFRAVTPDDVIREQIVKDYIAEHIIDWQSKGWIPDMRIEVGGPPRYQGLDLIRARGWTYWHHLFNPRQLLVAGLVNKYSDAEEGVKRFV